MAKKKITILGLGLNEEMMTPAVRASLGVASRIVLQTTHCEAANVLRREGIAFETLDALYEAAEDFDAFQQSAAEMLICTAQETDVCYGVPGSASGMPILSLLRKKADEMQVALRVLPGLGYADLALAQSAGMSGFEDEAICEYATSLSAATPARPLCVQEMDNALLAGEVKLILGEYYPDELEVLWAQWDGKEYQLKVMPLYAIDRMDATCYSHSACLLIPAVSFERLERFGTSELCEVIRRLRQPDGCPWDREQTHQSLRAGLLEEAYEVADAIDHADDDELAEELGDLLLQVVFHAQIASEQAAFRYRDVTTGVTAKMIHRHPHVFSGAVLAAQNADAVLTQWEAIKQQEKGQQTASDTLQAVPRALPALSRAQKLQKRAARVGFDWDNAEDAREKAAEEEREWRAEWVRVCAGEDRGNALAEEMGDWLFSLVNVARLAGLDAEECLSRANNKFLRRFAVMERAMLADGHALAEAPLLLFEEYWRQAKQSEQNI